jgi:magnesium transporter
VAARFPWLLGLMLVQSASGWVIEAFEGLISNHVVLAAFLTMLVGGGGNSSGQTIAELVRRLGAGEISPSDFPRLFMREVSVGIALALGLGLCTFPRVRLLSLKADSVDAVAIAIAYMLIVVLANAIAVFTVLALDRYGYAAVGSPPVVQVLVDVLGITVACFVALLVYSIAPGDAEAPIVDGQPG